MRFKVGDRVQVRGNLQADECYGGYEFLEKMTAYRYAEGTVEKIFPGSELRQDAYYIRFDNLALQRGNRFVWSDMMLHPVKVRLMVSTDMAKEVRVHLFPGNFEGEARCCPDDTFSLAQGIQIAYTRAKRQQMNSLKDMPKEGQTIYIAAPGTLCKFRTRLWVGGQCDRSYFDAGMVFDNKEDAIKTTEKMLAALK